MGCKTIGDILHRYSSPTIDNFVSRLCYRWTVLILVALSTIITFKLAGGYSFVCNGASNADMQQRFVDSKCYYDTLSGVELTSTTFNTQMNDLTYYPWVNLILLAQACVFYLPHLLRKTYEGGYLRKLTSGLEISLGKEQKRSLEILYLAKFLLQARNRHRAYTFMHIFFEFCNFIISVIQIYWLRNFFGIHAPIDDATSTLTGFRNQYFPSLAKCRIHKIGRSGDVARYDFLCALPLNSFFMNIYLFLEIWYIILAVCTGLILVYRAVLIASFSRKKMLQWLVAPEHKSNAQSISKYMSYTDWFFLTRVRKCILDMEFAKLMEKAIILLENKDIHNNKDDDEPGSLNEELTNSKDTSL